MYVYFLHISIGYWQIQKSKLHIYRCLHNKSEYFIQIAIGTDNLNLIINKSNYVFKNLFRANKVPYKGTRDALTYRLTVL